MATESAANILATRMANFKQKQQNLSSTSNTNTIIELPKIQGIVIKPAASTWEGLVEKLTPYINMPGFWHTVRELYDQGYGAELETAAEIAHATAKKNQINLFTAMVSKKSGNWATKTLKVVHETWQVRRDTMQVMEKLKLKAESTKAIFAIAWRLKGTIIRYLGLATEQGVNIRNPIGLFFALTKKPQPQGA